MTDKKKKKTKGFSLAELLTILSVLLLVNIIMIPSVINNYKNIQRRAHLKSAMESYETVMHFIQTDTRATSMKRINRRVGRNCEHIKKYLNVTDNEGCTFQTPDGMWYQFDLHGFPSANEVGVAFSKESLENARDLQKYDAFIFVADMHQGVLYVNDYNYLYADGAYTTAVGKLHDFLNEKKKKK